MKKLFLPSLIFLFFNLFRIFPVFLIGCDSDTPSSSPKSPTPKENRVKKDIQFCDKANAENSCEKSSSCKKDCNKLFFETDNEEKCQKLTTSTVEHFKILVEQMKDKEEIKKIVPKTLGCFLQIDPEEFSDLVEKSSRQASRNFLVAIAKSEDLAEVLENKDDDFDVLEELFQKAVGGNSLHRVLTRSIESGNTFLQIAEGEERNQQAFYWLDNYVDFRCEDGDEFCGDEEEPLKAYCKALIELSDRDLKNFLDDARHFEEEYSGEVEDAGFDYDTDGFRDFCSDEEDDSSSSSSSGSTGGGSPSSPTPSGSPSGSPAPQTGSPPGCTDTSMPTVALTARTEKVRVKIVQKIKSIFRPQPGFGYGDVKNCHLKAITSLDLSGSWNEEDPCRYVPLKKKDFDGLTKLEDLNLRNNCLEKPLNNENPFTDRFFSDLPLIKTINLQDTGVTRLPRALFTAGNIQSLENKGVKVSGFVYCATSSPDYESKLGLTYGTDGDFTKTNDAEYRGIDMSIYCY